MGAKVRASFHDDTNGWRRLRRRFTSRTFGVGKVLPYESAQLVQSKRFFRSLLLNIIYVF